MSGPRLPNSRELSAVPIARYFMVVGSALVALLLIAGWSLRDLPPSFPSQPEVIERAAIRIRSAHKWPEKVVLDTSQPTIPPPAVEDVPAPQSFLPAPDEPGDRSNLASMAQLNPNRQPTAVDHPALQIKRGVPRTTRSKRVARGPTTRRLARAEADGACCQFGWIDNDQTSWNVMLRRHAASSRPAGWLALTGRN
jgi:hypothetical protein